MSTENIADLRAILFQTARALADKQNPMDVDRARAISDVAQVVVNTAKVEIAYLSAVGGKGSGFIPDLPPAKPTAGGLPDGTTVIDKKPGVTVTRHTLKG